MKKLLFQLLTANQQEREILQVMKLSKNILVLGWLLVFSLIPLSAQPCGDSNSDGKVDITDALLIAQYYVGQDPPGFIREAADVNEDNSVNIIDALHVAQYYVGIIDFLVCQGTKAPSPTPTPIPWEDTIYTIDGYDREATFENIYKLTGDEFFNENGDGKVISGLHYGTGTRTGSSQLGGHFFGDIILPDEIKDNVAAVNRFDLFSDDTYLDPILAGAVLEIRHLFLDDNGQLCPPIGTDQDTAYIIVTDSMFDGGRIKGDIDIFTTTYDKIKGSTLGTGCLFVNWKVVEFSNLSKNLQLSYKWVEAKNPYYLAFKLLWHKLPIKSVSFNNSKIERTHDNVFKLPNQAVTVSGSAEIEIHYLDESSEKAIINGPRDTEIHPAVSQE
ncbi:MAG: hypothetical protein JXR70_18825 [Spirochaetales bacterium]|nr:hypothetical protein [Spirochaetales bacterium]